MKKSLIILAAAVVALMPVSCKKNDPDVKPEISKMELVFTHNANAEILKAYTITFDVVFNGGKKSVYEVKAGQKSMAFAKYSPVLTEEEKDNVYEYTLTCTPVDSYVPGEDSEFNFNFQIGVNAYDAKDNKLGGSGNFYSNSIKGKGVEGFNMLVSKSMKSFTEKYGVSLGQDRNGNWMITANKVN